MITKSKSNRKSRVKVGKLKATRELSAKMQKRSRAARLEATNGKS